MNKVRRQLKAGKKLTRSGKTDGADLTTRDRERLEAEQAAFLEMKEKAKDRKHEERIQKIKSHTSSVGEDMKQHVTKETADVKQHMTPAEESPADHAPAQEESPAEELKHVIMHQQIMHRHILACVEASLRDEETPLLQQQDGFNMAYFSTELKRAVAAAVIQLQRMQAQVEADADGPLQARRRPDEVADTAWAALVEPIDDEEEEF